MPAGGLRLHRPRRPGDADARHRRPVGAHRPPRPRRARQERRVVRDRASEGSRGRRRPPDRSGPRRGCDAVANRGTCGDVLWSPRRAPLRSVFPERAPCVRRPDHPPSCRRSSRVRPPCRRAPRARARGRARSHRSRLLVRLLHLGQHEPGHDHGRRRLDAARPSRCAAPAPPAKDTVTLTATAADGESGVADVVIEYLPVGRLDWVTVCTSTTAPYSCSWNTTSVADGGYDVGPAPRTVPATRTDLGRRPRHRRQHDPRGRSPSRPTSSGARSRSPTTVYNAGGLTYTVRHRVRPGRRHALATSICCATSPSPYACSWVTTGVATPTTHYDLRAVAVVRRHEHTSAVVADVAGRQPRPHGHDDRPGHARCAARGTFAATAADANSGLAAVAIQYAAHGHLDLEGAVHGHRRAVLLPLRHDDDRRRQLLLPGRGHRRRRQRRPPRPSVANRVVDNTVSSVSLDGPGHLPDRHVNTHRDRQLDRRASPRCASSAPPPARSTWTDVCTDTTSPYSCALGHDQGRRRHATTSAPILVDGVGQDHDLDGVHRARGRQQPRCAAPTCSPSTGAPPPAGSRRRRASASPTPTRSTSPRSTQRLDRRRARPSRCGSATATRSASATRATPSTCCAPPGRVNLGLGQPQGGLRQDQPDRAASTRR